MDGPEQREDVTGFEPGGGRGPKAWLASFRLWAQDFARRKKKPEPPSPCHERGYHIRLVGKPTCEVCGRVV